MLSSLHLDVIQLPEMRQTSKKRREQRRKRSLNFHAFLSSLVLAIIALFPLFCRAYETQMYTKRSSWAQLEMRNKVDNFLRKSRGFETPNYSDAIRREAQSHIVENVGGIRGLITMDPSNQQRRTTESSNTTTCLAGFQSFQLLLTSDENAKETSWELKDDNNVVHASIPFETYNNSEVYTYDTCLPKGCYTFTIFDKNRDGMCCDNGHGSFSIKVDGLVVGTGGNFSDSES